MKIRPTGNFLMLPNPIIEKYLRELGSSCFSFLVTLFFLAGRYGDGFYQSDKQIQEKFGFSESTIKRVRKKLKAAGLIEYQRGFKTKKNARATRYNLVPNGKIRSELRIKPVKKNGL